LRFYKLASEEISDIYDILEESNLDGDFDLISDVLYIKNSQGEYVINQHSPTKQIWLSSPVSNAGYFNYNMEAKEWLDKNNISLKQRLALDLKISFNKL
jgi:iron donor protein CyaY